jgi:hypothetical protein
VTLPEVVPPAKVETPKNRGRSTAFGVPRRSPKGAAAAAKGDATPSESEVPTATPPSEPALPPMNKDAALRLAFGRMTTSGLEEASVRRLVQGAHGRAARCLREALEAEAPIPPGHGTLTIGSDGQGLVSTVSLSGLELPSITVLCITDAFHGVRVAEAGAAAGSADIGVDVIVP